MAFPFGFLLQIIQKTLLFKSFTGLSVQQFDDFFKIKESKYSKHEIKRLSSPKRERDVGAGKCSKLAVKDMVVMVYAIILIGIGWVKRRNQINWKLKGLEDWFIIRGKIKESQLYRNHDLNKLTKKLLLA